MLFTVTTDKYPCIMTCAICREEICTATQHVLSCGHKFHKSCINLWIPIHPSCPMCRAVIVVPMSSMEYLESVMFTHEMYDVAENTILPESIIYKFMMAVPFELNFFREISELISRHQNITTEMIIMFWDMFSLDVIYERRHELDIEESALLNIKNHLNL